MARSFKRRGRRSYMRGRKRRGTRVHRTYYVSRGGIRL